MSDNTWTSEEEQRLLREIALMVDEGLLVVVGHNEEGEAHYSLSPAGKALAEEVVRRST